ncbi:hypothetical protein [Clostridium sp.]|uniref:hypothetical protein n=1 Tax=Clostridium sp. TaxID=1506 RepID=UPI002FC784A8
MNNKNMFFKKLLMLVFCLTLCVIPTKVFASDFGLSNVENISDDSLIFEQNATEKDKEYVKLKNKLIDKYGPKKAYAVLGFIAVEEKTIPLTDENYNNLETVSPLAYDDNILTFAATPKSVTKGTMTVTMYKNLTQNYMDIWGEMTYSSGNSAGLLGLFGGKYGDSMGLSYDYTQVSKIGTSLSGAITNHVSALGGGSGSIAYGSTYARIVYTVKPNTSGTNIANCHGNTIMLYARRTSKVADNIEISIGNGVISVTYGDHYSPNYLEYPGW